MSVCTTCFKPGLPASGQHDCPGLGDIQLTRQLGRGLRVDTAPARARMALTLLADHGYGLAMVGDDQINIADQVLYQVVGYDAESAALILELVEDWRPKRAPDVTVCTPIPDATLRQMSEVSPELLTEQQLGRAENALERLRLAREALIRDGYFTADEVGPDVAPRIVEWLSHHRGLVEDHRAEVSRLRAGEEPGWDPLVVPTPGQWIARWNQASPEKRLRTAEAHIRDVEIANRCEFEGHQQRLEEDRQAWVAVARVRDVVADMEQITGARHWARILRKAIGGEELQQATSEQRTDQLAVALREVLAAFATVTSPASGATMGYQAPPIHPDDMARWRAALDQQGVTQDPGTERGEALPWSELRASGLLWLINRVAFHPRGVALTLHATGDTVHGWSLTCTPGGEPWQFDDATDASGHARAEATLAAVLNPDKEQQ